MKVFVLLLCVTGLFIFSCGTEEQQVPGEDIEQVDTISLVVSDTLGVLMGDSALMFGSISAASFDPRGNLVVLDALKAELSIFSPDLELISVVGRKGSGPGEFQYPRYFAILSDGRLAVSDWGTNTVSLLNSDYSFMELVEGFYPIAPASPTSALGGGYVAGGMNLVPSDSEIGYEGTTFVGLWNDGSEPDIVYTSYPLDISVVSNGENTEVDVDNVDTVFDTDPSGNVYITVRTDSTYKIDRYTPDGMLDLTIEKEWTRIAKTEEELAEEILIESHSRSGDGSTSAYLREEENTYPWHNAISVIKTDDSGNLWVGQGYCSQPVFHVYDSTGELIQVVLIPELEGVHELDYSFKGGLLAFDYAPEDYPKVYVLQYSD